MSHLWSTYFTPGAALDLSRPRVVQHVGLVACVAVAVAVAVGTSAQGLVLGQTPSLSLPPSLPDPSHPFHFSLLE